MSDECHHTWTRINLNPNKRCTIGKRHKYVDGICACGKMSRREEIRLRNQARNEIAAYELHMSYHEIYKGTCWEAKQ